MSGPATIEQPLVVLVTDYDELIVKLIERKEALGMTFETLDAVAGLPSGYSAKILGPARKKEFGAFSFFLVLTALGFALGLQMNLIEDQKAIVAYASQREKRRRPLAVLTKVSKAVLEKARPEISREFAVRNAQLATIARQKIPSWRRRQIARKAVRTRRRRQREQAAMADAVRC